MRPGQHLQIDFTPSIYAHKSRVRQFDSAMFYTPSLYAMTLRVEFTADFPWTLSVFLRLQRGDYDTNIPFPCLKRYSVTLLSQKPDIPEHVMKEINFAKTDSKCNGLNADRALG
jgi:hypothetical protein